MMDLIGSLLALAVALALSVLALLAVGEAVALVARLAGRYARLTHGVLRRRTPEFQTMPPHRPQDEPVPAHRSYFFGPALRDLRQLFTLARRMYRRSVGDRFRTVARERLSGHSDRTVTSVATGLALCAGLTLGAVLGALLLAALLLLHTLGVAALSGAALLTAGALRALDRTALWMKRLPDGMLCPHCYARVPHPAYDCPRQSCRRRHTDLRPGTYGLFRRRCACGERMPTLLVLTRANGRLQAYCTHQNCGEAMNADAGHARETVLPLVGGRAAGKTQLMGAMLLHLENAAARGGPAMRLADDESLAGYQVLREVLEIRGHTRGTRPALPRAHTFVLGGGRAERLVHLFDTAGERFVNREGTDELRYARAARTFVFVLDPLAVDAFWTGVSPPPGPLVDRTLASPVPPDLVFGQSFHAMRQTGAPLNRSRLAVAISKTDLLDAHGLVPAGPASGDSAGARHWLAEGLGLGNLTRSMETEFREVRYFFTASVTVGDRQVHPSIAPLVDWCLDG
ncbi:hypothetical protein ACIO1C_01915 [Streptomyces sp. NPDC087420]|uniref:TRAFAC clade GTPase domain-containing protein n=1 Tax=Streptomyces sp. NPDC087420 TaxID=3365785 RepID=UPI003839B142